MKQRGAQVAVADALPVAVTARVSGLAKTPASFRPEERELLLEESEERYRRLVENVREGIGFVGPGGAMEYCNEAYADVLGLSPKELGGRSFFDFVSQEHREKALSKRDLWRAGEGFDQEMTVTAADGRKKHVSCGVYPVLGPDGSYRGAVHTLTDVTKRKLAEESLKESEERFRLTFERAAVGMAHVAPDGTWLRVNDKLSEIVGYSREELLGLSFQEITHPDDLDADLRHVERVLTGEISQYSVEKRYVRKDRSHVWVELTVSPVRDQEGETSYFISVVEDITERKLKELLSAPLTDRESEVLRRVAAGLTNREIACELLYSVGTIKLCIQRLIVKLEVKNREQASARAIDIGLIPPPGSSC